MAFFVRGHHGVIKMRAILGATCGAGTPGHDGWRRIAVIPATAVIPA
jgi:hypothetical protein